MGTINDNNESVHPGAGRRTSNSRRRLVALLATGSTGSVLLCLPDAWKRPVVESVMLPAHGQTTTEPDLPPDLSDGTFSLFGEAFVQVPDHGILDYFASTARAGTDLPINTVTGCLELSDGRLTGEIFLFFDGFDCVAEYDLPGGAVLNGSVDADDIVAGLTEFSVECDQQVSPATLEFVSVTGTAPNRTVRVRLTTSGGSEIFDCPEGPCID